jgi:hypothetical protein
MFSGFICQYNDYDLAATPKMIFSELQRGWADLEQEGQGRVGSVRRETRSQNRQGL